MPAPKFDVTSGVKWFKFASGVFEKQRQREKEDLKCQTPEGMWPDDAVKMRSATVIGDIPIPARPMISIPTMDEPVMLVLNGQRKAHLGINVHALSEDASDDTAEIFQGLFRAYEREGAHMARMWAFDRKVKCGTGWWRILKVYDPDGGHPLDQKLIPKRILYQNAVIPDPFAEEMDWSDGKRLQFVVDIPVSTYKERYTDSKLNNGEGYSDTELVSLGNEAPDWIGGDGEESRTIRLAEEYVVIVDTVRKHLLTDNSMASDAELQGSGKEKKSGADARYMDEGTRHVWRRVFSCVEDLEPWAEQDGQYIPFIFDPGRELQPVDGKRIWYGMYATAKQPAQLVNYAASGAVEMAALEPKAPWQGEEGVFEGHEKEYQQANIRNFPYLQYRRTNLSGQPTEKPERVQVDVSRLGPSMQLLAMGREFVQAATSTFDPALGKQPTAHRSGRALIALQDQTVEGTSHYLENHKDIAMTHEARIFLDLAPKVYDRPGRIARILGEDGTTQIVMFNTPYAINPQTKRPQAIPVMGDPAQVSAQSQGKIKYIDLSKGRYGVSFTIGKSQTDRLQQGSEEMGDILSSDPAMMPIIGSTYFKYRDFPGAKTIAKLLEKLRDHQFPFLSDNPQGDPAQQLAKAQADLQQLTAAAQQMKQDLDTDKAKALSQIAIENLRFKMNLQIEESRNAAKIEIARITAAKQSADLAAEATEEEIALGREHAQEANLSDQEHQHALAEAEQAHQQAMEQADQLHQQTVTQNEQQQAHSLENVAAQPAEPTTPTE